MSVLQLGVWFIAHLADGLRRSLDVGEEEGNRPRREPFNALFGPRKCRVLRENPPFELPDLRARVDAELAGKTLTQLPTGSERIGLSSRAVQRGHPVRPQPFPERVLTGESIKLTDELAVPTDREVGGDPLFQSREARFFQAGRFCAPERLIGDVGEWRPSPQRKRFAVQSCRATVVT